MQVKLVCATLSLLSGLARKKGLRHPSMSVKDDAGDRNHGLANQPSGARFAGRKGVSLVRESLISRKVASLYPC
jgi:hypothetical protein